jgi:hypothetical protein
VVKLPIYFCHHDFPLLGQEAIFLLDFWRLFEVLLSFPILLKLFWLKEPSSAAFRSVSVQIPLRDKGVNPSIDFIEKLFRGFTLWSSLHCCLEHAHKLDKDAEVNEVAEFHAEAGAGLDEIDALAPGDGVGVGKYPGTETEGDDTVNDTVETDVFVIGGEKFVIHRNSVLKISPVSTIILH